MNDDNGNIEKLLRIKIKKNLKTIFYNTFYMYTFFLIKKKHTNTISRIFFLAGMMMEHSKIFYITFIIKFENDPCHIIFNAFTSPIFPTE